MKLIVVLFNICFVVQFAIASSSLMVQTKQESDLAAVKDFISKQTSACQLRIQNSLPSDVKSLIQLRISSTETSQSLFSLSKFLQVDALCPQNVDINNEYQRLQGALLSLSYVSAAYIRPQAVSTIPAISRRERRRVITQAEKTPIFQQDYLNGPKGFNVKHVSDRPGGKGQGVKVIDIEYAWELDHEDITSQVLLGTPETDVDHGTAVLGVINGVENDFGIVGIAPKAQVAGVAPFFNSFYNPASAIVQSAQYLDAGDVLLLEQQIRGQYCTNDKTDCYIAVEWYPDIFHAIKTVSDLGILVIEATGNSVPNGNLDDPIYNRPSPGFPSDWVNPFNRSNADSGAIIVSAGSVETGGDRTLLPYTNYGSSVDVQAWGELVVTAGYGDLFHDDAAGKKRDYTQQFAGSSSASACIAGIAAVLQGLSKAGEFGQAKLITPLQLRHLFRNTGSPQLGDTSKRIGNRPDFVSLVDGAKQLLAQSSSHLAGQNNAKSASSKLNYSWILYAAFIMIVL
jgi:hypothetical protein